MVLFSRVLLVTGLTAAVLLPACSRQAAPPSTGAAPASAPARPTTKPHPFKGKVEKVEPATKLVTVAGENVEGWMGAMTMPYVVDPPEMLNTLKAGDEITATVYEGTFSTLYDVKIASAGK